MLPCLIPSTFPPAILVHRWRDRDISRDFQRFSGPFQLRRERSLNPWRTSRSIVQKRKANSSMGQRASSEDCSSAGLSHSYRSVLFIYATPLTVCELSTSFPRAFHELTTGLRRLIRWTEKSIDPEGFIGHRWQRWSREERLIEGSMSCFGFLISRLFPLPRVILFISAAE